MSFDSLATLASQYAFPAAVALMVLDGLGAPVWSEALLPFAGYLAAQGDLNPWSVIVAAAIGGETGALAAYGIARRGGGDFRGWLERRLHLDRRRLGRVEGWLHRSSAAAIVLGRHIPGGRAVVPYAAGIFAVRPLPFGLYNLLTAWTWPLALVWLGFFLNEDLHHLTSALHFVGLAVLSGLLAVMVIVWQRNGRAGRGEL